MDLMTPNEIVEKLRENAIKTDLLWVRKNTLQTAAHLVGSEIEAIGKANHELWKQLEFQTRSRQ